MSCTFDGPNLYDNTAIAGKQGSFGCAEDDLGAAGARFGLAFPRWKEVPAVIDWTSSNDQWGQPIVAVEVAIAELPGKTLSTSWANVASFSLKGTFDQATGHLVADLEVHFGDPTGVGQQFQGKGEVFAHIDASLPVDQI